MIRLDGISILVVAPHVDDEVTCAGLLHEARERSSNLRIVTLSLCEESVPDGYTIDAMRDEWIESCRVLGAKKALLDFPVRRFREHRQDILETLVEIAHENRPDLVICPSFSDIHQDHQVVCEECQRAFRQSTILGWEPLTIHRESRLDTYIAISSKALDTKIEIWKCYRSQHGRSYLDDQLLRSLAVVRGKQARIESGLAEAYEVIRAIRA